MRDRLREQCYNITILHMNRLNYGKPVIPFSFKIDELLDSKMFVFFFFTATNVVPNGGLQHYCVMYTYSGIL